MTDTGVLCATQVSLQRQFSLQRTGLQLVRLLTKPISRINIARLRAHDDSVVFVFPRSRVSWFQQPIWSSFPKAQETTCIQLANLNAFPEFCPSGNTHRRHRPLVRRGEPPAAGLACPARPGITSSESIERGSFSVLRLSVYDALTLLSR